MDISSGLVYAALAAAFWGSALVLGLRALRIYRGSQLTRAQLAALEARVEQLEGRLAAGEASALPGGSATEGASQGPESG